MPLQQVQKEAKLTAAQAVELFELYITTGDQKKLAEFRTTFNKQKNDAAFRKEVLERLASFTMQQVKGYILTGERKYANAAKLSVAEFKQYSEYTNKLSESMGELKDKDADVSNLFELVQQHWDKVDKKAKPPPSMRRVLDFDIFLKKAVKETWEAYGKGLGKRQELERAYGVQFVAQLYRGRTMEATPVATAKETPLQTATREFRSYVIDGNYKAWGRFTDVWKTLKQEERNKFSAEIKKDREIAEFDAYYRDFVIKKTGDQAALVKAAKECYSEILMYAPKKRDRGEALKEKRRQMAAARNKMAGKHGWKLADYVYSNMEKLAWLAKEESAVAREISSGRHRKQVTNMQQLWQSEMMEPHRMLAARAQLYHGMDSAATRVETVAGYKVMSVALQQCYNGLKKVPDREGVMKRYATYKKHSEFVAYMESKRERLATSGLVGKDAKTTAELLGRAKEKGDRLAQGLLMYVETGETIERFAARMNDIWYEVKKSGSRREIESKFGKEFVTLVMQNRAKLWYAEKDIKEVQKHIRDNTDGSLIKALTAAWQKEVASNSGLVTLFARNFKEDMVQIREARTKKLEGLYGTQFVGSAKRLQQRRTNAELVGGMLLPLLAKSSQTDADRNKMLLQVKEHYERYTKDSTFHELVLSFMPAIEKNAYVAWCKRTGKKSMHEFASHVTGLKVGIENNAWRYYIGGLRGEGLTDAYTLMGQGLAKAKAGVSYEEQLLLAAAYSQLNAEYKAQAEGDPAAPKKVRTDEIKRAQNELYMRQSGRSDRMVLQDLLDGEYMSHTLSEDWADELIRHLQGIKLRRSNAEFWTGAGRANAYDIGFEEVSAIEIRKKAEAVMAVLSRESTAKDAFVKKYGERIKPLVEFISLHMERFGNYNAEAKMARERGRSYDLMDAAEEIGLKAFYQKHYADVMTLRMRGQPSTLTQGSFQTAVLEIYGQLVQFDNAKKVLGRTYGKEFVWRVEDNYNVLQKNRKNWPNERDYEKRMIQDDSFGHALLQLNRAIALDLSELEKRATDIWALHRNFRVLLVTGVELERQLKERGMTDLTNESNKNMFSQLLAQTKVLTGADIAALRTKPWVLLDKLPVEWQIRLLERYIPEAQEAADVNLTEEQKKKKIRQIYAVWVDRLDRTRKDTDFTQKFQDALLTRLMSVTTLKIASDYNAPKELRATLTKEVTASTVIRQYMALQPETRYEIYRMIKRAMGKEGREGTMADVTRFLNTADNEGIARIAAICVGIASVDQFYAPLLLRSIGGRLAKYQPMEIQILLAGIGSYTQMYAKANSYHYIQAYYASLPQRLDKMFTTIQEIYNETVQRPGIMVKPPSEQKGYVELIVPSLSIQVNIPKTVYTQYTSSTVTTAAGQAVHVLEIGDATLGPLSPTDYESLKKRFITEGLIHARVNAQLPWITAPLAISQLWQLAPDFYPKGKFRYFRGDIRTGVTHTETTTAVGGAEKTSGTGKGTWSIDGTGWGRGKSLSGRIDGSFTTKYDSASGTSESIIQVDNIQSSARNFDSVSLWKRGKYAFPQEPGGSTEWDITLQRDYIDDELNDISMSLSTLAPGGPDTVAAVAKKRDLNGDWRYSYSAYKRVGDIYVLVDNIPLIESEGQYYFQRIYGSKPDVFRAGVGERQLTGRGGIGAEVALVFAESPDATAGKSSTSWTTATLPEGRTLQGIGGWSAIGRSGGLAGAYEHTREGRVFAGGGVLDSDSQVIAVGRLYYTGMEDREKTRIMMQWSEIAPKGAAPVSGALAGSLGKLFLGAEKTSPATFDAFAGAAKVGGDWLPVAGLLSQTIGERAYGKIGGLYTPEYYGGASFLGDNIGVWAVTASAMRRKLEHMYVQQALYGDRFPWEKDYYTQYKNKMGLLSAEITDAALGVQMLFGNRIPLRVIMGGALTHYKPGESAPLSSTQKALGADRDERMLEERYRSYLDRWEDIRRSRSRMVQGSFFEPDFKALLPSEMATGYLLTRGSKISEKLDAAGIVEFSLYGNQNFGLTKWTVFRGLYLGHEDEKSRRHGGLGGMEFVWRKLGIEFYGEGAAIKETTDKEWRGDIGGAIEIKLRPSPRLSLTFGAYRSPLSAIVSGGHVAALYTAENEVWEALTVATFTEGEKRRTFETAAGMKLNVSPRLDLYTLHTMLWQTDTEKNLSAFQTDAMVGFRMLSEYRDKILQIYAGMQYWQTEREGKDISKFTVSQYRAFLRGTYDWLGVGILQGNAQLGVELSGGGRTRQSSGYILDVLGMVTLTFGF